MEPGIRQDRLGAVSSAGLAPERGFALESLPDLCMFMLKLAGNLRNLTPPGYGSLLLTDQIIRITKTMLSCIGQGSADLSCYGRSRLSLGTVPFSMWDGCSRRTSVLIWRPVLQI